MKRTSILIILISLLLIGCNKESNTIQNSPQEASESMNLMEINKDKTSEKEGDAKIVVTSVSLSEIMGALDIHLAGVPYTSSSNLPTLYEGVPRIGLPMNPDMEVLAKLEPTVVYAPENLRSWTEDGLKKIGVDYEFIKMSSVDDLYQGISHLGSKYGKEAKASELLKEHEAFMKEYQSKVREPKKVLILMGLPGSYMAATQNSYVGSLLELSGAQNVLNYEGEEEFIQVGPETLLKLEPDVILRASHAMPDDVKEMFAKEFETNSIWKHFKAVEDGKVYDLNPEYFGMSANFRYKEALLDLDKLIYE